MRRRDNPDEVSSIQEAVKSTAEALSKAIEESALDHSQARYNMIEEIKQCISHCGFWEKKALENMLKYIEWELTEEE